MPAKSKRDPLRARTKGLRGRMPQPTPDDRVRFRMRAGQALRKQEVPECGERARAGLQDALEGDRAQGHSRHRRVSPVVASWTAQLGNTSSVQKILLPLNDGVLYIFYGTRYVPLHFQNL